MTRHHLRFALACGALALALAAIEGFATEPVWVHAKQTSDGIAIFTREIPGTTVRAVRATLTVATSPLLVLDAACDPATYKVSRQYVEEQAFYGSGRPDVWFNYQMLNFPVVSRRDYVLRYERVMDPGKQRYQLRWTTSTKHGPPPRDGVIRVTMAEGRIDITPLSGGKRAAVEYTLVADPGGSIPGWVADIANRVTVPTIVREIRDEALRRTPR
jgi:hypothetical protein